MKIINYGGKMPTRKHTDDVGADVYCLKDATIFPHETYCVPLGFGAEIPNGYAGLIMPRSSMAKRGLTAQIPPVDPNYRGEIHAIITNYSNEIQLIEAGDRIAQLVVVKCLVEDMEMIEPEEASETDRGSGAFGSTGV